MRRGRGEPIMLREVGLNAWKSCFWITYGQWREGGASPANSQTAAEMTCGTQP
jgi:hypothetical protein